MPASFTQWFHAPFGNQVSVLDIIMVTGLVIIASVFWFFVISKLRGVVE